MLLHQIVEFATAATPDATALIDRETRWSFADLHGQITSMAEFVAASTDPGDRVLVLSENSAAMVASLYAVPLANSVATFANTRHTIDEIAQLCVATRPTMVLGSAGQLARYGDWASLCESIRVVSRLDDLTVQVSPGAQHDDSGLAGSGVSQNRQTTDVLPESHSRVNDTALAWLIHTSGTTGKAKGARLTHRSLMSGVLNTALGRPLADDDIYLFPFPLFHVAAYNVLHAHLRRRPVVLVPGFEAGAVLELIRSEGVTCCSLAPTMLSMLLDYPGRKNDDLAGLRQVSYGASSMPRDLLLRMATELPDCGLAQGYGMTELSGNAVFLDADDHRRAATSESHLLSAAGRPGPLVKLRIVDDDGHEVDPGEVGEILVQGDQVCDGYWNSPQDSNEAMGYGWLHTGDIGRLDANGYLYVVDRKKDLIISGGENVSSREVEDILSTHPSVAAVAVVGATDPQWGELVCAVIVPRNAGTDAEAGAETAVGAETAADQTTAAEIIEWTRGRMAGFKRPRRIEFVDSLPTNASGKVDKVALRGMLDSLAD